MDGWIDMSKEERRSVIIGHNSNQSFYPLWEHDGI